MPTLHPTKHPLATQARELFTAHAGKALPDLAKAILEKLSALVNEPASARDMQTRRDIWLAFQSFGKAWVNGTNTAWKSTLFHAGQAESGSSAVKNGTLELIGNEVMENNILASRLALRLANVANSELNDIRLRVQSLDSLPELDAGDILRPEVLARHMVEQWIAAGLSRDAWALVQDVVQNRFSQHLLDAYRLANELLVTNGVMAEIDLRPLVKRTPSAIAMGSSSQAKPVSAKDNSPDDARGTTSRQDSSAQEREDSGGSGYSGNNFRSGSGSGSSSGSGSGENSPDHRSADGSGSGRSGVTSSPKSEYSPHEETRMQTATTPLARARMRAQGVMGGLMRLLTNHIVGFDEVRNSPPSPQLARALIKAENSDGGHEKTLVADIDSQVYGVEHVERASSALRQRTAELKQAATTSSEKATIEIVALMFQSILSEDRIPPAIRVWFARLQMPVLRVAISEPEFFGSLQHPARRLIDRMGSCVLGFDATVSGSVMEVEIKRIVQVIEQYPETGRRVFQLVYDEFQKFLSKFLSQTGSAARVVSIAQQVEQKETMAIQYTIEMRKMLNDMPVRDEIREFLFKVWAEVLAIAAMRNGPQHEQTVLLKRSAADLVWAASAKPNRADRAKVIADLPKLLQLLRVGMTMLGLDTKTQDRNIKTISDTLADAFMSKTDAISPERVEAMANRLANLEDYLSDEDVGDLPLDTESLVTLIGIDASDIEVITDGGSQPTEAMRAWAQELQLGAWFSLDHNNRICQVQFAWRSDRNQMHLFASSDGRNYLIQSRRLAAYLQAGLLLPTEEEALTVRATRNALAKLEANPERLLS